MIASKPSSTDESGLAPCDYVEVRILIRRSRDGKRTAPEATCFEHEDHLERLIAEAPELLPGIDGGPPRVVVRQLHLPVGRADVLA